MSAAKVAENPEIDLEIHKPLERVNYEAGMLLGLEATRAEQAYHRQRLNRLQYWFQGAGTLLGLLVKMVPPTNFSDEDDQSLRLIVTPGIAIDGLGRELLSYEPYCVNLRDWLKLQKNSFLNSGLQEVADKKSIQLCVTIRYQAAASGLQPVMTRKVNAGIDPVQPSRARDGILLEIIAGAPDNIPGSFYRAGLKMKPLEFDQLNETLTFTEKKYFDDLDGKKQQLTYLQSQLLYGMTDEVGALELKGAYDELARLLLATIEIPVEVIGTGDSQEFKLSLNPEKINLNNLIRPFITTPDQLTWLNQEEMPS
jgi:hypothetical protein